jgi:hypothetical protein
MSQTFVWQQEEQLGASGSDGAANASALVDAEIVHHHDVAGQECRPSGTNSCRGIAPITSRTRA